MGAKQCPPAVRGRRASIIPGLLLPARRRDVEKGDDGRADDWASLHAHRPRPLPFAWALMPRPRSPLTEANARTRSRSRSRSRSKSGMPGGGASQIRIVWSSEHDANNAGSRGFHPTELTEPSPWPARTSRSTPVSRCHTYTFPSARKFRRMQNGRQYTRGQTRRCNTTDLRCHSGQSYLRRHRNSCV